MSRLRVVTGPTVEPVETYDVKTYTHVSHSVEDSLIAAWIKTARQLAEDYQGRAYIEQTLELSFDAFPDMPIYLPRAPLQSVTSIKYTDYEGSETTLYESGTEDMFIIDTAGEPGRIDLAWGESWPAVTLRSIDAVHVRYVAGYGDAATDVPGFVRDAIMLYCGWRYENRAAESGQVPEAFYGLLRADRVHTTC